MPTAFIAFLGLAAAFAGILLGGCASTMQKYNTHHALRNAPLAPYVQSCLQPRTLIGQQGLQAVQVSPPVGPHHRPLYTDRVVTDSVSVRTGHRVMYAFKDAGYFFANVKIEQSNPAEYSSDQEAITRQLRALKDTAATYSRQTLNGLPLHSYEGEKLDDGGTIGIYTAFLDRDHLVVTAYLLNQGRNHRRFHTIEEYRSLRDRFLDDLTACIAHAAD